ncbi:MAG: MATE family efflux transporter [Muribaculaceae bacterium]|nr:MATE family efflux transporter [Muribaculaceae bacterium]
MEEKENNIYRLGNEPVGKLLWQYSLPAIVGIVVMSLYNIVDRIFIGQGVGSDAIAGLAITFPVMNLSAAVGTLIGAGAAARISIVLGQNDKRKAELILGNSLVLTLLFGFIYIMLFSIFLDDILRLFGASETTLPYAHDFMAYILPGMLIMNLCFSFNNIMRASGYPSRAMVTMFIGAGLNVVLAPTFIFLFEWGIKGAAIATDIAMTISMLFVMSHFVSKKSELHFKPGIYKLKWSIFTSITAIGAAPFVVNMAGSAVNGIVNNLLHQYGGDSAVGALGILMTYAQLLCMIVIGITQGMQPIIGFNYGARKFNRLKKAYWLSVAAASAVTFIGTLGAQFAPQWIARAFTTDPELIANTSIALRIGTVIFWAVGFQIVSTTMFQSLGLAGQSIFLSLTRQILFLLPLIYIMSQIFGLTGIWIAYSVSDFIATLITGIMITYQMRKLNKLVSTLPKE